MVHFIVVEGDSIRPLCGEWSGSPSWTRVIVAVTCPRCRKLLEQPACV